MPGFKVVDDINTARATSRGTKIVKPGQEMDKNAFLRILTAELSNQDPENAKDSTQYVTQMAQFAGLEQMSNLNTTMVLNSANNTVGKNVAMDKKDADGNQYTGIVREVFKEGSNVKASVEVMENGKSVLKDFDYSDIISIFDNPYNQLDALSGNMSFLLATSFMGKGVEISDSSDKGSKHTGTVKSVFKEGNGIKVAVELENEGSPKPIKNFIYQDITKVNNL